ncbi:MAG: BatD family protein [Planctomycetota bacterium]
MSRIFVRQFISVVVVMLVSVVACDAQSSEESTATIEIAPTEINTIERTNIVVRIDNPPDDLDIQQTVQLPDLSDSFSISGPQIMRDSRTSIVNGRLVHGTNRVSLVYSLTPRSAGTHTIPPFSVVLDGARYTSDATVITVNELPTPAGISLTIRTDDDSAYVGQAIPVTLVVETEEEVQIRDLELDIDYSGSAFDVLKDDDASNGNNRAVKHAFLFGQRFVIYQIPTQRSGGQRFEAKAVIIPKEAGSIDLDATLRSAFVRRSLRSLRVVNEVGAITSSRILTIRELPSKDEPSGFKGLVGEYQLLANADSNETRVGDPIKLRVRITGPYVSQRIDRLELERDPEFAANFRISDEIERITPRSDSMRLTYTLRAMRDDINEIPPIKLSYFNPENGTYETDRTLPIPLSVQQTKVLGYGDGESSTINDATIPTTTRPTGVMAPIIVDPEKALAGSEASPSLERAFSVAAIAIPPLLALAIFFAGRTRREPDIAPREAANTVQRDQTIPPEEKPARLILAYAGALSRRDPATLTTPEAKDVITTIDPVLADRAAAILVEADAARYAPSASSTENLIQRSNDWLEEIEEVRR